MAKPGEFTPNPKQQQAIEHVLGPMLVVAGAGTGKTSVLTRRIAYLIEQGHARPDEILAITFTRNAAAEVREKVRKAVGTRDLTGLCTATFHSYCYGLLKRHAQAFQVLDTPDLWIYLRRRIRELPLERFVRAASPGEFLAHLLRFFDRCNEEMVDAAAYSAYVGEVEAGRLPLPFVGDDELPPEEVRARCREIANIFAKVEAMLAQDGLGTFGAIITRAVAWLRSQPEVLAAERARARFILIDEFQDSNTAQIELARLLAGEEQNVFAVGDPDQAIYRFRGASDAAFEAFLQTFTGVRAVYLDENQRSTSPILECAHAAISQNPEVVRDGGGHLELQRRQLRSAREQREQAAGRLVFSEPVDVLLSRNAGDEAASLAAALQAAHDQGIAWSECAVLYRKHAHREKLTPALDEAGIPYEVEGVDVLETTPVRDLLAVLRALEWPSDAISLLRVAALPQFGIRAEEMRAALAAAPRDADMTGIIASVPGGARLAAEMEAARAFAREQDKRATAVVTYAIRRFAIDPALKPVRSFVEFVQAWQRKPITETGSLPEFLEYVEMFAQASGAVSDKSSVEELEADADGQIVLAEPEHEDAVRLMTVHAAKGLEFKYVHVVRASSTWFPSRYEPPLFDFPRELRRMAPAGGGDDKAVHQQEERRLFYVAMTRARDGLSLWANTSTGRRADNPTEFLRSMKPAAPAVSWRQRIVEPLFAMAAAAATAPQPLRMQEWFSLPPRPERLLELSASAIDLYERCPLQFKIARDWKLPAAPGAALLFGSVMHDVLRSYYEALRLGRRLDAAETLAMFESALAEKTFDDEYQRELYRRQGIEQLQRFCAQQERAVADVIATERSFKLELAGTRINGRIDLLDRIADRRVRVVDYKTGAPKSQEDADKSLQLSLYALAVERVWELIPEVLVFFNLESGIAVETRRTPDDLRAVEARVRGVAECIAAGEFDPKPGRACRWCAYRALCPATEQRLYTILKAGAGVN
jgi:DNA helicase-2/ATP-dependent DNA helicase PcrA